MFVHFKITIDKQYKILLDKRRIRGYGNIDRLINMIYFISGKLKFNYSQYIT